ncbi:MAG: transketolase [Lachnospiraceae bacterium]|nr:transketolase [Lachnospiraceae bacterium]
MKDISIKELQNKTTEMRMKVIDMIYKAQSGHPGGALSAAEFMTACYFKFMNIDPKNPRWEDRDRMVLSKGHVCPIQYACLASVGYFPVEELDTLRKEGSKLQGHPSMIKCPGIDISTGSLGQGLACAVGMALAGKMDKKDYKVFCVIGDGEAQEGEIWEAANTAHKYKLDNLIAFIDVNNLQLDGTTDEVMPNGDLGEKFKAFGWDPIYLDGNDMEQVVAAIDKCYAEMNGNPKVLIGSTVKGKGVSFMENQCGWHGVAPNTEQYEQAMEELKAQMIG